MLTGRGVGGYSLLVCSEWRGVQRAIRLQLDTRCYRSRLQDETARVEDELSQPHALQALSSAFVETSGTSFEAVLEP